ncbi:hypothetical protein DKX38_001075 [Salix brachista]|uniref:PRONE domain-containing protein n=1 Tax=Salix brachista TaxID=2182728 RepID=A0A5N5P582_9ROSI|nr:hypothetical protein DKX38_001075 [Salix brachista]
MVCGLFVSGDFDLRFKVVFDSVIVLQFVVDEPDCSMQTIQASGIQVMESRPRSDIYINLPALRKLDAMLMVRKAFICRKLELLCFHYNVIYKLVITRVLIDRKCWIVSKMQNFGMQNKEACHRIHLVQARFGELLLSVRGLRKWNWP